MQVYKAGLLSKNTTAFAARQITY